ncbi:hypothetical protein FFF34_017920 [Inquilinus sp. KBS0705]|nr:hypothetical protein FFF34_017920 [Inquilinus sp. KBS0705]
MKEQLTHTEVSPQGYLQAKHSLYNSYGGMLLGYILEIVKSQTVAEQYLVDLFADIMPANITELSSGNVFCKLQLLARKKLSAFFESLENCALEEKQVSANKFTNLMNADQQQVFCGVQYYGKSIAKLAAELGKSEDDVRRILKESFTVIRNNRV